jgi:signal transduction histidine kinase
MAHFSACRHYDLADETRDEPKYIKLQIEIEDNGAGMEEKDIDKLFKDYSMLNRHKHLNQAGTGLGLSICKNIVNKMGG